MRPRATALRTAALDLRWGDDAEADEDEATAVAGLRNDTEGLLFFPAAAAACVAAVLVDMARVPRTAPNAHYRV